MTKKDKKYKIKNKLIQGLIRRSIMNIENEKIIKSAYKKNSNGLSRKT